MKEKLIKYISITFLVSFFILITVVGLKECPKLEKKEPDIVCETDWTQSADHGIWRDNFEVFMGEDYE